MPCVHVYNMFQSAVKYFDMGFESVSCWLFLVWGVFYTSERYIFLTLNLSLDMRSRYAIRYPTFSVYSFNGSLMFNTHKWNGESKPKGILLFFFFELTHTLNQLIRF